jgi:hypothetical protein
MKIKTLIATAAIVPMLSLGAFAVHAADKVGFGAGNPDL